MANQMVAVADDATGTVEITVFFPSPPGSPVYVVRVHPDGTEHPVLGSPVVISNDYAVLYDNAAPMDVPVYYKAYASGGTVAYDGFSRIVQDHWNPGALLIPGTAGNYASTPDAASLDIVGDIDIRAGVSFADWTPTTDQTIVSKWNTAGDQRSWHFTLLSSGKLRFAWTTAGTGASAVNVDSTVATGFQAGLLRYLRVTLDVSTAEVRFYTSDHAGGWLQLGDPVIVAPTSIFSGTATVNVGARSAGTTDVMSGRVWMVEILNGIAGTVVANPQFNQYGPGVVSFADGTGKTWTLNGTATFIEWPINLDWDLTAGLNTQFDVNGMVGQQTQTSAGVMLHSTTGTGLTDMTVKGTASINQDPVTGAAITARVWARVQTAGDYYEATLFFNTSDTIQLSLGKRIANVFTNLVGPITLASSFVANEQWRIAIQTEGPEVRAKAWPIATSVEPTAWQLTVSDTSLTVGTLAGLASRREVGNTNVNPVISWDEFEVYGPAAEPPATTLRYDFTQSVEGWVGEGATSVAWVEEPAFSSPGALQVTKALGAGADTMRFNDADQLPSNLLPWGRTFYGWILVPEDAPGTDWVARLEVQDNSFAWQVGEDVALTPGEWVPISFAAPSTVLADAHAVGVQIGVTGANSTVSVYFDSMFQTFETLSNYIIIEAAPDGWLKHPTMPMLDIRLDNCEVHTPDCLNGDQLVFFKALDAEEYSSASGVLDVVNSASPFVVAQRRKNFTTNLVLVSRRLQDITMIRNILSDGIPLILNLPTIYGWGIETFGQEWIQVGDDSSSRLGIDMRKPYRTWNLPLAIVDEGVAYPSGGTGGNDIGVAGATWGDLAASGLTWAQLLATGNTWLDTAQGDNY